MLARPEASPPSHVAPSGTPPTFRPPWRPRRLHSLHNPSPRFPRPGQLGLFLLYVGSRQPALPDLTWTPAPGPLVPRAQPLAPPMAHTVRPVPHLQCPAPQPPMPGTHTPVPRVSAPDAPSLNPSALRPSPQCPAPMSQCPASQPPMPDPAPHCPAPQPWMRAPCPSAPPPDILGKAQKDSRIWALRGPGAVVGGGLSRPCCRSSLPPGG